MPVHIGGPICGRPQKYTKYTRIFLCFFLFYLFVVYKNTQRHTIIIQVYNSLVENIKFFRRFSFFFFLPNKFHNRTTLLIVRNPTGDCNYYDIFRIFPKIRIEIYARNLTIEMGWARLKNPRGRNVLVPTRTPQSCISNDCRKLYSNKSITHRNHKLAFCPWFVYELLRVDPNNFCVRLTTSCNTQKLPLKTRLLFSCFLGTLAFNSPPRDITTVFFTIHYV